MNMFDVVISEIAPNEYGELKNFLYEAIYIPDNIPKPPREIIEQPELQVYVKDFGTQVAEFEIFDERYGEYFMIKNLSA